MRRALCGLVVALLPLPALAADDKPQDDKPRQEEKKATPKEQYDALVKQFAADRAKQFAKINQAGGKEQQELLRNLRDRGREVAEKVLQIAEENPKDPVAVEAVFWVLQNPYGRPVQAKALEKAVAYVPDMPLKDLARRLDALRDRNDKLIEAVFARAEKEPNGPAALDLMIWVMENAASGSNPRAKALEKVSAAVQELPLGDLAHNVGRIHNPAPAMLEAILKRAEKDAQAPEVPDLLTWVAVQGSYLPVGLKAASMMVAKHPEHASTTQICRVLGDAGDAQTAAELLKQVLAKTTQPRVKTAATLSMGLLLTRQSYTATDSLDDARKLAAEAESCFTKVIDDLAKNDRSVRKRAEEELALLRKFRVGTDAPEITAADLDKKDFKLSDYKGKVVLLDFWGHW